MNTLTDSTSAPRVGRATAAGGSARERRDARLAGAAIVVLALAAMLPQMVLADRWSANEALITWLSVGLPFAFVAFGAALWRTGGAHRIVVAPMALSALLFAAATIVDAATGAREAPFGPWPGIVAIVLFSVAGLDVLALGAWRGAARILPAVAASWALVAVVLTEAIGSEAMWWAAFGTLVLGLVGAGVALAVRPDLAVRAS